MVALAFSLIVTSWGSRRHILLSSTRSPPTENLSNITLMVTLFCWEELEVCLIYLGVFFLSQWRWTLPLFFFLELNLLGDLFRLGIQCLSSWFCICWSCGLSLCGTSKSCSICYLWVCRSFLKVGALIVIASPISFITIETSLLMRRKYSCICLCSLCSSLCRISFFYFVPIFLSLRI